MEVRCTKCEAVFDTGVTRACPGCGATVGAGARIGRPRAEEGAGALAPAAAPAAAPDGADEPLPATMRANKRVAGKTCPGCARQIQLGVEVRNCEACQASHHQSCWDMRGACAGCGARPGKARGAVAIGTAAGDEGTGGGDERPCKMCGEPIKVAARKCRHCGEFQDEKDRKYAAERKSSNPEDDDMTTGDWVVGIMCGLIGCLAGLVWTLQGKKKGPKMLVVSLVAQLVWGVVRVILESAAGRR